MARRSQRHLRKRPVPLTEAVRADALALIAGEHEDRLRRGYTLRSVRLWMNARRDFTLRFVYRGAGAEFDTLTHVVKGRV